MFCVMPHTHKTDTYPGKVCTTRDIYVLRKPFLVVHCALQRGPCMTLLTLYARGLSNGYALHPCRTLVCYTFPADSGGRT